MIATTSNFKRKELLEKKTHQVVAIINASIKPVIMMALLTKRGYSSGSNFVVINAIPSSPTAIIGRYKRRCVKTDGSF
jgi:hypothetical protein